MNKVSIVSPITCHSSRLSSHRSGWARMWARCLNANLAFGDDWSDDENVFLEHGMEFKESSKGVNVFLKDPEAWDKLAKRARMFESFKGKLYSLDIDCPDYGERLKSRVKPHSTEAYRSLDFGKISEVCARATTVKQEGLQKRGFVLGDSHALSAWRSDANICRLDGKTLHGILRDGFDDWIDRYRPSGDQLLFFRTYFGNIDIRHHICRLAKTDAERKSMVIDLVSNYCRQLYNARRKYGIGDIQVVASLPIENEARKLPKTGYFQDRPFWGSWQERHDVHVFFNEYLEELCNNAKFTLVKWPRIFSNLIGELGFPYMEKPRSVHISPQHYLWRATKW